MRHRQAPTSQDISRRRGATPVAVLTGACLALMSAASSAQGVVPPSVPLNLVVEAGHEPYRIDHAVGTQNYVCVPAEPSESGPEFAWVPFGPQATLFSSHGRQTLTHFLSRNPDEGGMPRPTWQDSRDTSTVWAKVLDESKDPAFVEPGAIPWLVLKVVGAERGPNGGRRITGTTHLQRVNTSGGKAPTTGCAEVDDVGDKQLVPYTADYVFYRSRSRD